MNATATANQRPFVDVVNDRPNLNININDPAQDIGGFRTYQAAYGYIRAQSNRPFRLDRYGRWLIGYENLYICHDGVEKRGDVYVIRSMRWSSAS